MTHRVTADTTRGKLVLTRPTCRAGLTHRVAARTTSRNLILTRPTHGAGLTARVAARAAGRNLILTRPTRGAALTCRVAAGSARGHLVLTRRTRRAILAGRAPALRREGPGGARQTGGVEAGHVRHLPIPRLLSPRAGAPDQTERLGHHCVRGGKVRPRSAEHVGGGGRLVARAVGVLAGVHLERVGGPREERVDCQVEVGARVRHLHHPDGGLGLGVAGVDGPEGAGQIGPAAAQAHRPLAEERACSQDI